MESKKVTVKTEMDITLACQEGRRFAGSMGFSLTGQACIVTSISELGTNLVLHAHGGTITLSPVERKGVHGLEVLCEDEGHGIENIEMALQDGYSTRGGLGGGLPGIRRLMDEFEIQSQLNQGTRVIVRKWL